MNPLNPSGDINRRALLGAAMIGAVATELVLSGDAKGQSDIPSVVGSRAFNLVKQVKAGDLSIGYVELGPTDGLSILLLHGWPYDIHTYAEVAPMLAAKGFRVITPYLRGYGTTRFLSIDTARNAQQSVFATDMVALLDALGIKQAVVAGCDWGARTACILSALWPDRFPALVSVSGYLIGSQQANSMPLAPKAELSWWYQFYFATDRGRLGYAKNRGEFARLIWRSASPTWTFDPATFERSARALDNPDHVDIVIHNYRWRLGLAEGDPQLDTLEAKLAAAPSIVVPTITLEGDANGAPHPQPSSYSGKFTGPYAHRTISGGIGHNLPQEAPAEFAKAVVDVSRY